MQSIEWLTFPFLHLVDPESTPHTQLSAPPWGGLPWLPSLPIPGRQIAWFLRKQTLASDRHGLESWFGHLLTMWAWASYRAPLIPQFPHLQNGKDNDVCLPALVRICWDCSRVQAPRQCPLRTTVVSLRAPPLLPDPRSYCRAQDLAPSLPWAQSENEHANEWAHLFPGVEQWGI